MEFTLRSLYLIWIEERRNMSGSLSYSLNKFEQDIRVLILYLFIYLFIYLFGAFPLDDTLIERK